MPRRTALVVVSLSLAALALGLQDSANARKLEPPDFDQMMIEPLHEFGFVVAQFRMEDAPLGGSKAPTTAPHAGNHGGTLAVDADGLLVLDRDTGKLLRTNRDGAVQSALSLKPGAGELVSDGAGEAYVADRRADTLLHVRVSGAKLQVVGRSKLREPHGLALSPDGKTLYATSVADRELVALDTETMRPRWRVALAAEPRGVTVSPDGHRALVGFLSTGTVASVELGPSPNVTWITLDPAHRVDAAAGGFGGGFGGFGNFEGEVMINDDRLAAGNVPASSVADVKDVGLRFARNTHVLGYVGNGIAIAPHQLSAPHLPSTGFESAETYGGGGGFLAPITHRMAMIDGEDAFAPSLAFAEIGVHQPRALAYDAGTDTLFVAGYGNDQVMAIGDVSQASIHMAWVAHVPSSSGCGPDGLAVDNGTVFVHCELERRLVALDLTTVAAFGNPTAHLLGVELGPSSRTATAQRGAELFRRGQDPRLSSGGFMACASCHPEGRTDGLSWRIEGHNLQTPLLAGRLMGTHPFKWDGQDQDLRTSLTNTVGRLGGSGLTADEVASLEAFLGSLPPPVPPTPTDTDAIARGKQLFESGETGCVTCHAGPELADGGQYDLATNIGAVDTPSLIGLAHSAPYYHDGSARTLRALLTDRGSVHGMGETKHLDAAELDDMIAYLESL